MVTFEAKTLLSTAASIAASVMFVRTIAQDFLPHQIHDYFFFCVRNFFTRFSSQLTLVIHEFDGLVSNQIYESAETYLGSKISPSTRRLKVSKNDKEKKFSITMERNEEVIDVFDGAQFKWSLICKQVETKNVDNPRDLNATIRSEVRSFELSFHKKFKDLVLRSYLPYIIKEGKSMKQEAKTLKIFTVDPEQMYGNLTDAWTAVNLDHPSNFDTLALDPDLKQTIMRDLVRFVERKDHYRKIGKAWKRGYLLYGPPGTGKSSLIAAMANYLNFDIYDLELTDLSCNSELRRLLVATANRSILVVEDIDCTIELQDRLKEARALQQPRGYPQEKQVTLSGLLNFTDGLWSSCGDERIIVFTTNHIEKLDPALLRPGRMDVHIRMSYCTPCGFKLLASNYLAIQHHDLFSTIEDLILTADVSPAEVAEQLLKFDDHEIALTNFIEFLGGKKKENDADLVKINKEKDEGDDSEKVHNLEEVA